jgi:hypothetical protein
VEQRVIAATLVDQAKDYLNVLALLLTAVGLGVAIAGPRLLDEGHRVRKNGYLAIGLALIGLALTVSQLVLMAGLVWSSLTSDGSFQPWLLVAGAYFVAIVAIALVLLWTLFKAVVYTTKAEKD